MEYLALSIIPTDPILAITLFFWKAPRRDIISPTQLADRGIPVFLIVKRKKNIEKIGMYLVTPR